MIDQLAIGITGACLVTGGLVLIRLVRRRFRRRDVTPTLVPLELGLLVQAGLDVAGLAHGHRPAEPPTHIAYLVSSVLVVPSAAGQTREDDGRWSGALLVLVLLITAVLVVSMQTTWRAA